MMQTRSPGQLMVGSLMVCVMFAMLGARISNLDIFNTVANTCAIALLISCWRLTGLREIYLISVSIGLSVVAKFSFHLPLSKFVAAINQATFLIGFLLLLSILHGAAKLSPAIAECGKFLTKQPPTRRYFAVYSGTNIMSVLFNLGIVSLLTPLIKKGSEQSSKSDSKLNENKQLSAMLRGFAWGVVWSPTALAPLALFELIEGINREAWILYGVICAVCMCFVGWVDERWSKQENKYTTPTQYHSTNPPLKAMFNFFMILTLLLVMTVFIAQYFKETFVFGFLVSCPIFTFFWLWVQSKTTDQSPRTAFKSLRDICLFELPKSAKIIVALASSGYIGKLSAELVPGEYLVNQLGLMYLPDFIVLIFLSVVMVPFSWLGVSPIMMSVFFGTLLGNLPNLPVDPTLAALAISCGWALSMTTSPFATVALMTATLSNRTPLELTLGSNIRFTLMCMMCLCLLFYLFTAGT